MSKQVSKQNLRVNVYLSIFRKIPLGYTMRAIADSMGMSKQALNRYTANLKRLGAIKLIGKVWKICAGWDEKRLLNVLQVNTFSGGSRGRQIWNLHALQIKIPVSGGGDVLKRLSVWTRETEMRNWIAKFGSLDALGGLTLRNNNNKSLVIYTKPRDFSEGDDYLLQLAYKVVAVCVRWFKNKGVVLDGLNARILNIDLATYDEAVKQKKEKGKKISINLDRSCEKILPADEKRDAKVYFDDSPVQGSVETNDLKWMRDYSRMPGAVKEIKEKLDGVLESNDYSELKSMLNNVVHIMNTQADLIKAHMEMTKSTAEELNAVSKLVTPKDKSLKRGDDKSDIYYAG